jgi:hypothetical protein
MTNPPLDNVLPRGGQCLLCGRYYDMNEVELGVYVDFFLHKQQRCTCPTCFSEQLHRVEDPQLDDVLFSRKYCDVRPSALLRSASKWRPAGPESSD